MEASERTERKRLPVGPGPRHYRAVWRAVVVLAALQTIYAACFIYRSSSVVEGRRYFCLYDDAMISMRTKFSRVIVYRLDHRIQRILGR